MSTRIEQLTAAAMRTAARAWSSGQGVKFTISGTSYYGIHTDDTSSLPLSDGGFVADADGIIHAVKTDFATLPAKGLPITITMDGTSLSRRIKQVITSQGDAGVQIVYGPVNS